MATQAVIPDTIWRACAAVLPGYGTTDLVTMILSAVPDGSAKVGGEWVQAAPAEDEHGVRSFVVWPNEGTWPPQVYDLFHRYGRVAMGFADEADFASFTDALSRSGLTLREVENEDVI